MTRGTFVIIVNESGMNNVYTSTEYNGDMYLSGNGVKAYLNLKEVKTKEDFMKNNKKWNKDYMYEDDGICYRHSNELDFRHKTYFDNFNWFSDYLYVKNLTDENLEFLDYNGKTKKIKSGEVKVLNFGEVVSQREINKEIMEYDQEGLCEAEKKALNKIKQKLLKEVA